MKEKKLNIIMLPLARWDGPYSSTAFSLALELSKRHNVFYLDNPFTLKDVLTQIRSNQIKKRLKSFLLNRNLYFKLEDAPDGFTAVFTKPVLPINFLPKGPLYNFLLRFNDQIVTYSIDKLIRDYNLKEFVLINSFNPFYGHHFEKYKPLVNIYQSVDNITESKYISKHGTELEIKTVQKADLTLTTSIRLSQKFREINQNVFYLPNAADVSLFRDYMHKENDIPDELKNITKKIIGYFGNICHRLDYELLEFIASIHTDKIICLVGPLSGKEFNNSKLSAFKNIILPGKKNLKQLPAYLNQFDVAIIPFKVNKLTASIYPLKVNEYLAGGKPVVSTCFSEDIQSFSEIIYLSKSKETFAENISKALQEDTPEKTKERKQFAENNSWEARAIQLETLILNELQKKEFSTT